MQKLFNRIQPGPTILVFLLISCSFLLSLPHKYSASTQQIVSFSTNSIFPDLTLNSVNSESDNDEFGIDFFFLVSNLDFLHADTNSLTALKTLDLFSLFKTPLLYFLFSIPPPFLS